MANWKHGIPFPPALAVIIQPSIDSRSPQSENPETHYQGEKVERIQADCILSLPYQV